MFANRFTAFADACVLAGVLRRNLLCSLAEAEFFRLRWSDPVLDEVQRAIESILTKKGAEDANAKAAKSRIAMEAAFEDAKVTNFEKFMAVCEGLPDPNDAHVVAAALKTRASVIVTDNLRDFPKDFLNPLNIEALSADAFIADTITLDYGRAVAAIRRMRERFKKPEMTAERLLIEMEAVGLIETVDMLKSHIQSL